MNRFLSYSTLFLLIALLGWGCSRKKDKFLNRTWHDVTTKNNTLYNGRMAFDLGKQDIVQADNDNFWKLLPVERLTVSEDVRLPNEVLNKNFDRAEEKAVKAIQKHSMLIDGRERNPKIDEAFLLLGKARYFEQRFIPALEAFNYILYKYPTSNTINHAKVWKAKSNIRLDNNKSALEDLYKMITEEYMKPQDYADATAMIAQAYINLKQKDSAITYLNKSAIHTRNNEEKGRYYYIKGQLLNQLGYKDSANYAFDQVIALNRRTARKYLINARLAKARNFEYAQGDTEEFLKLLTKLEKNRENRPFLDKIYNQIAVYYRTQDSIEGAVTYYNKSLRTDTEDKYLKSLNYYALGDINFDAKEYPLAGAYYDSTLSNMIVDAKRYRVLKKKRTNLDDVILYEGIAKTNDSILSIVAMSPEEQLAYYNTYTETIKAAAVAKAEAEENALRKSEFQQLQPQKIAFGNATNGPNAGGIFYFYNPTTIAFGKTAFRRTYGDRELTDNWKVSGLKAIKDIVETKEKDSIAAPYNMDEDPLFNPQTYLATLPTDSSVLDSLQKQRNFAYYQLGVIYKEKFLEYDLAIDKFETVLSSAPEERLIVPSKYNLYKIYESRQAIAQSNALKQDLINNHGDSRYAKILQYPDETLAGNENSPEALYNKLYKAFQNQEYAKVISESDVLITRFGGEDVVPKFELLKAQAMGRYRGFEAYKAALNYVALNFPQSPEGKKAQYIYENTIPQIENATFLEAIDEEQNHKLIYTFSTLGNLQAIDLKERIQQIIKELKYDKMKVSLDIYTKDQQFIVVHTKKDRASAEGLAELLSIGKIENTKGVDLTKWDRKKNYYPKIETEYFTIASPNYRIVQIHKNLETYSTQQHYKTEQ